MKNDHQRIGLAYHPSTPAFLARAYGMSLCGMEDDMPLYRDQTGKLFWGGYGSFYSICLGEESEKICAEAEKLGKKYGLIEGCFALSQDLLKARHLNFIITIPEGMRPEERLDMYERNIKKHVRNTVAHSSLRYEVGSIPSQWYDVYVHSMSRDKRSVHTHDWFSALEASFGSDVIVASAYDSEKLVGALYCIRYGDYLHLLSIATDSEYRQQRVDSGLYDKALVFAIEHRMRYVDFGLTGTGNLSLVAFKQAFGGTRYYIATYVFGTPICRLLDLARRVERHLKRTAGVLR